jgi:hypothetical protein
MQFFEGRGMPYPMGGLGYVPRIWNGKIFYNINVDDVDETPFSSTMPNSSLSLRLDLIKTNNKGGMIMKFKSIQSCCLLFKMIGLDLRTNE